LTVLLVFNDADSNDFSERTAMQIRL